MKKVLNLVLIGSLVLTSMSVTGCGAAKAVEEQEEEIINVEVVNPSVNCIEVTSEYVGSLEYEDETSIYPKLSGEVTETFFEEGDFVNEGDLLFTIDDEALQMALDTAQATYKNAKAGTDQQLGAMQMTRDGDVNTILTAQENMALLQSTYDNYERSYGDYEEQRQDLEDDIDDNDEDLGRARKKLKKAKEGLKDAKGDKDAAKIAKYTAEVAEYEAKVEAYEAAAEKLDSAIDGIDTAERNLNLQKQSTVYSYQQTQRGEAIAQENLEYYDNVQGPATIKSAEASLELAQVNIDSANLQIGYTKVTSPVSGYVKQKNVEVYGMAAAGQPAYVITNDDGINATFTVPEDAYRALKEGQEVTVVRRGVEYKGKIVEIPNEIDAASGLFKIKAELSGDTKDLISGTSVEVYAVTNKTNNSMVIPVECVYYEAGQAFVYTVNNGEVSKVYIETGLHDNSDIEVVSGLEPEAQVISTWSSELRNGLKVNVSGGTGLKELLSESNDSVSGNAESADAADDAE